jgi:transcription initiation factor IIF auxiliary subunit
MPRKLNFVTTSQRLDREWWEWEVALDEPPAELEKIEEVEYVLHRTFPNRIHVQRDAKSRFRLRSRGWGGFDIIANVRYRDGEEVQQLVPLVLDGA